MEHFQQLQNKQQQGLNVFTQKNADYGDSFAVFGVVGVIVRMQDKITRIINLLTCKTPVLVQESLMDTSIDLFNYSTMALMLLKEENVTNTATENKKCRVLQMRQVHQQGLDYFQANITAFDAKLNKQPALQGFKILSQRIKESVDVTHNSIVINNLPNLKMALFDMHVFSGLVEILADKSG